ncbi:MAG TPA: hypothetical protein VKU80_15195, partial [Planctomycetota bacterium]|nr:hypothetical protein [Planctomycetota bacterium]
NFPARAIALRERMLVDSNLDWGQDLGRLRTYLQKHGIPSVKLAYFGTASPRAVGLVHEVLPATGLYIGREKEWPRARDLRAFDWVAVSATTYAGIASDHRDFYRNLLGGLEPEERIGHSILLYHLPAGWKRVSIPVYR